MVACTLATCCEKCEMPTASGQKMSIKAAIIIIISANLLQDMEQVILIIVK